MSKPTLYYMLESGPVRCVIAVARILGIELELKSVNLVNKEQLRPEFVALNPFHVIPTLVDSDGFTVWESRAICTYLIQSRDPQNKLSTLYPSDLKARTNVDKMLQYELGTLSRAVTDVTVSDLIG